MNTIVQNILNILQAIAPVELAESWDNVGLMVGSADNSVSGLFLGLDPTIDLLDEAEKAGANTIITHHPIIFHPLKSVRTDNPDGHFIHQALCRNFNVIGCHTNFDCTNSGVSDCLAKGLGLKEIKPLVDPSVCPQDASRECGIGRTGLYTSPLSTAKFLARLQKAISAPWLLGAGPMPDLISQVAVCGGSGSDFAEVAFAGNADVYISSEIKHSTARWAESVGFWVIDAGHFATENPAMQFLANRLNKELEQLQVNIATGFSQTQVSPLQILKTRAV